VRFLPTGKDVLRCELLNSIWRSSTMCPLLPPVSLTAQDLSETSPSCLARNAHRLSSLHAALIKEPDDDPGRSEVIEAKNRAALEVLAAAAVNLSTLVVEDIGRDLQDSVWSRLTSLTRLELHNSSATNFPASFGALTGLQHLQINRFSHVRSLAHHDEATAASTDWLQQLTQLTTLSVNLSNLRSIEGRLPASLQELNLDNNRDFERLTVDMAALTDLRSFTISGRISYVPAGLGNLQQLSRLCFNDCNNVGRLPVNLGQATSVKCVSVICRREYR
jgi:Leucine-rich repeat (LRR) protein